MPTPSKEQLAIIQAALQGRDVKVQAFAGTGKTTTIKMIAAVMGTYATYVVFNKAAKKSVEGEIKCTRVMTAHALAFRAIVAQSQKFKNKLENRLKIWNQNVLKSVFPAYKKESLAIVVSTVKKFIKSSDSVLSEKHINAKDIEKLKSKCEPLQTKAIRFIVSVANEFKSTTIQEQTPLIKRHVSSPSKTPDEAQTLAYLDKCIGHTELINFISAAITNYKKYSDSDQVTLEDFPNNDSYRRLTERAVNEEAHSLKGVINQIVDDGNLLWNSIADENSAYPINHDCYLKIWQLSQPTINSPVIFIDESQDLDPVMLSVLLHQTSQKIWVGDRYQQIYAWRGAVNAMDRVGDCLEYSLTETYRFTSDISAIANTILRKLGERLTITSFKSRLPQTETLPKTSAFIARYNSTLVDKALALAEQKKTFSLAKFDSKQLVWHCQQIISLRVGKAVHHDLYATFNNINDLEQFLEEEHNDMINRALSLCKSKQFDIVRIRETLSQIDRFNRESSELTLITAHQSKGLEWDRVTLADDFANDFMLKNGDKSELNLFYVAVTRAKVRLER
ncbi:3'-5' exonuclease [Paraferrimonas haliotis]|uniref:3'-5' exonuclease n=1 Tax=Paraferrimonas haliotis TaxID=2013866 RepID=UPI0015CACCE7|nr:3'-5' exonuclease [Paraferrimonas haliotis]